MIMLNVLTRHTFGARSRRPVILKRRVILVKKVSGSLAPYLSFKVFRDWSIINIRERNQNFETGMYICCIVIQTLTAFVDLFYRCGLEKMTLHFDFSPSEMLYRCRVSTFRAKVVNIAVTGVSHSCCTTLGSAIWSQSGSVHPLAVSENVHNS